MACLRSKQWRTSRNPVHAQRCKIISWILVPLPFVQFAFLLAWKGWISAIPTTDLHVMAFWSENTSFSRRGRVPLHKVTQRAGKGILRYHSQSALIFFQSFPSCSAFLFFFYSATQSQQMPLHILQKLLFLPPWVIWILSATAGAILFDLHTVWYGRRRSSAIILRTNKN